MFITTDGYKFEKTVKVLNAEEATEAQLVAGNDCFVDYTDQTLVSRADDLLGDLEASFDGTQIMVEQLPSNCSPHDAYAARLEKKFKLPRKQTTLFAYMVYAQLGGTDSDVRRHYESEIKQRGFDAVFGEVRLLFFEMLKFEAKDEVRAFLGDGTEFRALPVDVEKYDEEHPDRQPSSKEFQSSQVYQETVHKITHATKQSIAAVGKRLYEWGQKPEVRALLGFENIKTLWSYYKERKEALASLA